jgi:hypothetical protein
LVPGTSDESSIKNSIDSTVVPRSLALFGEGFNTQKPAPN